MTPHALHVALVALLVAVFTGCTPKPKTMPPIDARNIGAYNGWRSAAALEFRKEPWPEFDAAIQELRVKAMAAGATGSAGVAEALCKQIDGRTFQEAMRAGYVAKMERTEIIRAELKRMVDANALIIPRAGDVASEYELNRRRDEQKRQLKSAIDEIAAIRTRIQELGGDLDPLPPSAMDPEPTPLSRPEALAQLGTFMKGYTDAAIVAYGQWTIHLPIPEAALKSPAKEEFAAIKAAAQKAGRSAMAIEIADQLLFFDEAIPPLVLSSAITANLTDKDLEDVRTRWTRVRAEMWARKEAAEAAKNGTRGRPADLLAPQPATPKRVNVRPDTSREPTDPGLLQPLVVPSGE